jgi:hypothetical protein
MMRILSMRLSSLSTRLIWSSSALRYSFLLYCSTIIICIEGNIVTRVSPSLFSSLRCSSPARFLHPLLMVIYASIKEILYKGSKNHGRSSAALYAGGAQPGTLDEKQGIALAGTADMYSEQTITGRKRNASHNTQCKRSAQAFSQYVSSIRS